MRVRRLALTLGTGLWAGLGFRVHVQAAAGVAGVAGVQECRVVACQLALALTVSACQPGLVQRDT